MAKNNLCAFRKGNACKILTVKMCSGESCSFAQTKVQIEASQKMRLNRLASLDKTQQRYIAEKYYNNKMPWLKGGVYYDF